MKRKTLATLAMLVAGAPFVILAVFLTQLLTRAFFWASGVPYPLPSSNDSELLTQVTHHSISGYVTPLFALGIMIAFVSSWVWIAILMRATVWFFRARKFCV
jgi:hypothetical protein